MRRKAPTRAALGDRFLDGGVMPWEYLIVTATRRNSRAAALLLRPARWIVPGLFREGRHANTLHPTELGGGFHERR